MNRDEMMTRWIDGALPESERRAFEAELEHDADLRAEVEMASRLGETMRAGLRSPALDVPAPEIFQAKLAKTLHDERARDGGGSPSRVIPFFRAPWLVAAAACVVAAFALFARPGGEGGRLRPMAYVPDPSVHADVYYDDAASATVIMLDGLAEIPADREVKPFSVASHEAGGEGKTVFFAEDDPARPLFVRLDGQSGASFHQF